MLMERKLADIFTEEKSMPWKTHFLPPLSHSRLNDSEPIGIEGKKKAILEMK